jgi:hypothetical protein
MTGGLVIPPVSFFATCPRGHLDDAQLFQVRRHDSRDTLERRIPPDLVGRKIPSSSIRP